MFSPVCVYEDRIEQLSDEELPELHSDDGLWFWSERIALIEGEHTDRFWRFQAVDLLTNELRPISFPKSGSQYNRVRITPLVENYGFIVERAVGHPCIINLVKIHWETSEIQVFERFERQWAYLMNILVDKLQPSKFVLRFGLTYEVCRLNDNGKIEFSGVHTPGPFEHYSSDKLFVFDHGENQNFLIQTYDLLLKNTQSIQIEELAGYGVDRWRIQWIKNRVYAVAKFHDEDKFAIAWTDAEIKRFTLLDITTAVPIRKLDFLNGKLIAYAKGLIRQDGIIKSKVEVHSIPIHRPNSLRQMSWLIVVQQMKDSGELDQYKAASRYLPFTTDLRAPWFTDEVGSSKEASKNQGVMDESEKPDIDDAEDSSHDESNSNQSDGESSQDEVSPKRHKPN